MDRCPSSFPGNFSYANYLDMVKISIEEVLAFLDAGKVAEAKTRCERNLLAIEKLKKGCKHE